MRWYRQVQFISAVAMPEQWADELGTTVNGMWASAENRAPEAVARSHDSGHRVLFSVPLIALTPGVYDSDAGQHLPGKRVLHSYTTIRSRCRRLAISSRAEPQ